MDQISLTEVIVFSVHPYSNFWLNFIDKEKRQANTLEHKFYISLLIDQEMKQNRKLDRKVNNQKERTEKLGLNSSTSLFYITVPSREEIASYFFDTRYFISYGNTNRVQCLHIRKNSLSTSTALKGIELFH